MSKGPLLFLGIFLTFASAWIGLALVPSHQLKDVGADASGAALADPRPYTDIELAGRQIYIADGCHYCHTQQIRGGQYNNDVLRGWGRRSVPQDYIHDYPVVLGTMRTGPDLVNIGARQTSANWHYQHLYDPQLISPGSNMPPQPYLFDKRPINGSPSPDAVPFDYVYVKLKHDTDAARQALAGAGFRLIEKRRGRLLGSFPVARIDELQRLPAVESAQPYIEPGHQIVPTDKARALVAYLLGLKRDYPVQQGGQAQ